MHLVKSLYFLFDHLETLAREKNTERAQHAYICCVRVAMPLHTFSKIAYDFIHFCLSSLPKLITSHYTDQSKANCTKHQTLVYLAQSAKVLLSLLSPPIFRSRVQWKATGHAEHISPLSSIAITS
jgi:hypothetical protein